MTPSNLDFVQKLHKIKSRMEDEGIESILKLPVLFQYGVVQRRELCGCAGGERGWAPNTRSRATVLFQREN